MTFVQLEANLDARHTEDLLHWILRAIRNLPEPEGLAKRLTKDDRRAALEIAIWAERLADMPLWLAKVARLYEP